MMVSIHQPQYLPWMGYFEKLDRADVFVFLDDVQFEKNGWENRNKIRTDKGWQWLTVPVLHHLGQKIRETRIDSRTSWARKHVRSIELNYRKAPFFAEMFPGLAESIEKPAENLAELGLRNIRFLCERLGIGTRTVLSSGMEAPQDATERLVSLCQQLGGDTYYSGPQGRTYLDLTRFQMAGIRVVFQEYTCPSYRQCFNPFVPNMAVIDLLFNEGPRSLEILRQGGKA